MESSPAVACVDGEGPLFHNNSSVKSGDKISMIAQRESLLRDQVTCQVLSFWGYVFRRQNSYLS